MTVGVHRPEQRFAVKGEEIRGVESCLVGALDARVPVAAEFDRALGGPVGHPQRIGMALGVIGEKQRLLAECGDVGRGEAGVIRALDSFRARAADLMSSRRRSVADPEADVVIGIARAE